MPNPVKNREPKQALALLIERLTKDLDEFCRVMYCYSHESEGLGIFFIIREKTKHIETLKNMQIVSFEELESVKTIIKLEQFVSKNYYLDDFHLFFPNYKSNIQSDLFNHANIDIYLDNLTDKSQALIRRGHDLVAEKIQSVVSDVRKLNDEYFTQHKINSEQYKKEALRVINDSRPILEKHRGFKKILGNLALFILTMGTAFLINKSCTGHFLFFKQTDSAGLLQSLSTGVAFTS